MKNTIFQYAFLQSLLATGYIGVISSFLFYVPEHFFGDKPDTVLAPVMMLMLLVLSVAVMGVLFFGRTILWYIEGRKKDAVVLLGYTLASFFILVCIVFGLLFLTV